MKTSAQQHAVIEQTDHNCTNWIGHRPGQPDNQMAGQTFSVPEETALEAIEIFPSVVTKPGKIILTLHYFDPEKKTWGPPVSSCSMHVNGEECNKWLAFNLNGTNLHKGKTYGFRVECPDSYIGIGEAAGSHLHPPFLQGEEWLFTKRQESGRHFAYFSLAFKVDRKIA